MVFFLIYKMSSFEIIGNQPLKGEIVPQGAKNEALQIISAVLLTDELVEISNIPDIKDVNKLIELLGDLGVSIERINKDTYTFQAKDIDLNYFQSEAFKAKGGGLRGSIMIVGPLLARFGKAAIPKPGGDKIGRRRLDTHFLGFEKLGAKFH
jgi:UDP-N-acetylglucosamine 1-carboxyvinyltransferase